MRVCRSIGTDLLAVEYDDKDACIAKMARSDYQSCIFTFVGEST
jgi:hypothetical protein